MRSMTGFGRAAIPNTPYMIELSGVNRKQLELKTSLPKVLAPYESALRAQLSTQLSRGSVFLRIESQNTSCATTEVKLNHSLIKSLYQQLKTLSQELGEQTPISWSDLLQVPGVIVEDNCFDHLADVELLLSHALSQAMAAFIDSKSKEGETLRQDFQARLMLLSSYIKEIEQHVAQIPEQIQTKMIEKVEEFKQYAQIDEERLAKEIFFFVQRADVAEELTRLKSHIDQMCAMIERPLSGRNMEFQIQEIQREITTLGNKTGGVEISSWIVKFKTEVERMKEQVQNVE